MNGLTLITPTGSRQEAFTLLEGYIARQTYRGPIQWIVVDDCQPPTKTTLAQMVLYPAPVWHPGCNSQPDNMLQALRHVVFDKVLIIEDDEWYAPHYIETMAKALDDCALVGEGLACYYNIKSRRYYRHKNTEHACFARTAFRSSETQRFVDLFEGYKERGGFDRQDVWLWQHTKPGAKRIFLPELPYSVGIKGMPGRCCINGCDGEVPQRYGYDLNFVTMKEWLGPDSKNYEGYYCARD